MWYDFTHVWLYLITHWKLFTRNKIFFFLDNVAILDMFSDYIKQFLTSSHAQSYIVNRIRCK